MRRIAVLLFVSLGFSCGGEGGSGGLDVSFRVSRGTGPLPCADVSEIAEVEVRLRASDGRVVPGFPRSAACDTGTFSAPDLASGAYTLEMSAVGELSGDPTAVLFKHTEQIVVPTSLDVVLDPQVAYLTLAWTFGEQELAPCGTEVDEVTVIVSTGAGQVGSYNGRFGCTQTPVVVPQPFDLQEYVIQVEANSAEGFPLFTHTAQRLLDRGQNDYTANFMPLGGQVFLDWEFVVTPGDMPIRMCNVDSVQVEDLLVTIESLEGGQPVTETVACTAPMRPYAFTSARFTQGRRLALVMEAEGTERFYYREEFQMPAGDRVGERLTLRAVGTASVAVEVRTSSCTPATLDAVDLSLRLLDVDPEQVFEITVDPVELSGSVDELWYGTYEIEASLRTAQGALCPRRELRVIGARTNAWDPIIF